MQRQRRDRVWHCFGCEAKGNVLDFVHRMEARDGAAVSIREAGLTLAEICGLPIGGETANAGRQAPRGEVGRAWPVKPSRPTSGAHPRGPAGKSEASGEATRPAANKPLSASFLERFQANLDTGHPYLKERGIGRRVIQEFGLGVASAGIMENRLCIPIHNPAGELVAYAGRWVGDESDLPEGEDKYKLPKGFGKSLELFNLHRVKDAESLVRGRGVHGRHAAAFARDRRRCRHGLVDLRGAGAAPAQPVP